MASRRSVRTRQTSYSSEVGAHRGLLLPRSENTCRESRAKKHPQPAGGDPASVLSFQLMVSPAKRAGGRGQGSRLHSRGRRCSFSGCPLPPRWLFWLGTSSSRRVAGTPLRKRLHQASGRKPRCDAANPRKASANSAAVAATACCQNGLRAAKIIRSHLAGWVPEEP